MLDGVAPRALVWTAATIITAAISSLAALDLSAQERCGAAVGAEVEAGWASYRSGEMGAARSSFDRAHVLCPSSHDAQVGLAYIDLREGDPSSARPRLESVFQSDSTRPDVRAGLARVEGREGKLKASERHWRAAVAAAPLDAELRAGLVQVLRWQDRRSAALGVLADADADGFYDPLLEAERLQLIRSNRPTAKSAATFEGDSDGNRMWTGTATATWWPRPDVALRFDSYLRRTSIRGTRSRVALGHSLTTVVTVDPGWSFATTLGGAEGSVLGFGVRPNLRVSVSSPGRHRAQGTIRYASNPLDYTSYMIERGVTHREFGLDGSAELSPRWAVRGSGAVGSYEGRNSNGRWEARVALEDRRTVGPRAGFAFRTFGFESDVRDGYYDPSSFLVAEVPLAWSRADGPSLVSVEVAPGIQRTAAGGADGSIRALASLQREWDPGRGLRATVGYATSGAGRLGDARGDYRYVSAALAVTWVF